MIESVDARVAVLALDAHATLLVRRSATMPPGRLLATSARAAELSRAWLERSS